MREPPLKQTMTSLSVQEAAAGGNQAPASRTLGKYYTGNITREILHGEYYSGNITRGILHGEYYTGNITRGILHGKYI